VRQVGDNSWAGQERGRPCNEASKNRVKWRADEMAQQGYRGRDMEASAMGRPISTSGVVSRNETESRRPDIYPKLKIGR